MTNEPNIMMILHRDRPPTMLAREVKAWRGKVSVRKAAPLIGLPWRTLEWVEQGKGFRYPDMLLIALEATKDKIREAS